MNEITLCKLKMVKEKHVKYDAKAITSVDILKSICLTLGLHEEPEEVFCIVTVDTKNKITGIFEVSRGSLSSAIVHPREIFKRALLNNAASIFCIHNHPSGDTKPSQEDITTTKRLKEAGALLGITVLDHLIIGDSGDFYSFKADGLVF